MKNMKLSSNQSGVIYHNARFLDLTYTQEYLLQRVPYIDVLPSEASDLIGDILEYIKSDNDKAKDALRKNIVTIIDKYKVELEKIA